MAKLEERTLFQEWQAVEQDWYSIYQWKRTTGSDYTEWISEWIWTSISGINLITDGLRQRPFRWPEHRGQIRLGTDISQITEKRLLRAMFNLSEVPLLSKVIDYENDCLQRRYCMTLVSSSWRKTARSWLRGVRRRDKQVQESSTATTKS